MFYALESNPLELDMRALLVASVRGSRDAQAVVTSHVVHQTPSGPVLGDGVPFNAAQRDALVEALTTAQPNDKSRSALMPANVLDVRGSRLVWWVRGAMRVMHVANGTTHTRFKAPWPALVLRASERGLAVAALRASRRPGANTPLFHAPLMNIGSTGMMCAGSATLPDSRRFEDMAAFEAALFDTNFSHVNHPSTLKIGKNAVSTAQYLRYWRQLDKSGMSAFPVARLVPMRATLQQWVNQ